jgi:septal ring factor EnvC (AmiA/AmiB activator)
LTLKDGENAELKSQLNEQQARSEELANRIRAEQASRDRVENRLKEIETLLGHQEVEKTANARRRFLINWSAVLVVLVATSALAVKLLKPAPGFWPTVLFAWSAIVFVWTWLAD